MNGIKLSACFLGAILALAGCKEDGGPGAQKELQGACLKAYQVYETYVVSLDKSALAGMTVEQAKQVTYDLLLESDDAYCQDMASSLEAYMAGK